MRRYKGNNKEALLSCHNLSVGYGGKAILEHIELSFEEAQFVSLLGPNGVGKTTLLRTLSRHLKPLAGHIELCGKPLNSFSQWELTKIMAVLTDQITPPLFSVFQFVALGRDPHTDFQRRLTTRDREVVEGALAAVHAESLVEREFNTLSGGERQKILIARALAQEPQLLILDEPTFHLDLKHRVEMMSILRSLCLHHRLTVVASLHDVEIAVKVSDRVVLVKEGGGVVQGAPEEVLVSRAIPELYNVTSASFNSQLGSLELHGSGQQAPYGQRKRVFVVGGMGCGAAVYRLLIKCGYAVSSGILYNNDIDACVATSLGVSSFLQPPAAAIESARLDLAFAELKECACVIDTGCDLNGVYKGNQLLLDAAEKLGKPLFCLFSADGQRQRSGKAVFTLGDLSEALAAVCEKEM